MCVQQIPYRPDVNICVHISVSLLYVSLNVIFLINEKFIKYRISWYEKHLQHLDEANVEHVFDVKPAEGG